MQRGDVPLAGCEDVSWQILRGSDGTEATAEALNLAQSILQVCWGKLWALLGLCCLSKRLLRQ